MLTMILRRLLALPLILLIIYTLTLTLAWAVPGSPVVAPDNRQPPREVIEAMEDFNAGRFGAIPANALRPHRVRG